MYFRLPDNASILELDNVSNGLVVFAVCSVNRILTLLILKYLK